MTRRRKIVSVAIVLMAAVGLVGCGLPAGVDGKLTDAWAAPAEPKQLLSAPGECHVGKAQVIWLATEITVDCALSHDRETTFVGEFTGAAAALSSAPLMTTGLAFTSEVQAAQAHAYGVCNTKTSQYLGRVWHDPRLRLHVVLPNAQAWNSGRRWFRCDLAEVDWQENLKSRKGSLKGVRFPALCVKVPEKGETTPVDCAAKHNAEYAGAFFTSLTKGPRTDAEFAPLHASCRKVIAGYLGTTAAAVKYLTGTWLVYDAPSDEWPAGRRLIHCFLWVEKSYTGSAKGKGGRNLP